MMDKWYAVYPAFADDAPKENYVHNGIDPEPAIAKKIAERFSCAGVGKDSEQYEFEILVGATNRPATKRALAALNWNQYGVFRFGSQIAVCGHCLAATAMAADFLAELSPEELTDGFSRIGTNSEWIVSFPLFENGDFLGMTDACFQRLEWVWMLPIAASEDGIDPLEPPPSVADYIDRLRENGYCETYRRQADGNFFFRAERGIHRLALEYLPRDGVLRLFSENKDACLAIPDVWEPCAGSCPVTLTQLALDYSGGAFGMGYVITLADGSFVIIDGGHVRVKNGYPKTYDHVRLYTLLEELNTRQDGRIVISGWFMTHEHGDHFNLFYWFCRFCRDFGRDVTLKRYFACPCSDVVAYNAKNPEFHTSSGKLEQAKNFVGGFGTVVLHTGDALSFGDVHMEILYTVDDLFPARLHYFNDASFVMKMEYAGQATMWLGDICEEPSAFLRRNYSPETLKSDIVQLAHHGLNGAEPELYEEIDAEVLLWSLRDRLVREIFENEPTLPHHFLARRLRDGMHVREMITHQKDNVTLLLPYVPESGRKILR